MAPLLAATLYGACAFLATAVKPGRQCSAYGDCASVGSSLLQAGVLSHRVPVGQLPALMEDGSSLAIVMRYGRAQGACTLPEGLSMYDPKPSPEELFAEGKPFTLVRWGDGEWNQMGMPQYKEVLQDYLSYQSSNYFPYLGTGFICKEGGIAFGEAKQALQGMPGQVPFVSGFYLDDPRGLMQRIWSQARVDAGLQPLQRPAKGLAMTCADLTAAPKKTNIVLVGPRHLHELSVLFREHEWIDAVTAASRVQEIADQMLKVSAARPEEHLYFLLATGWAKLPIMHKVYEHIKSKDTVIDIGSSFDPYANVLSRDYHAGVKSRVCTETPCFTKPGTCN